MNPFNSRQRKSRRSYLSNLFQAAAATPVYRRSEWESLEARIVFDTTSLDQTLLELGGSSANAPLQTEPQKPEDNSGTSQATVVFGPPTPYPGDADLDDDVDLSDLSILAANYGLQSGAVWGQGDFDGDGDVDLSDLSTLSANYGTTPTNLPPVVSGGIDHAITLPQSSVNLDGTVTDDGRPRSPGLVTTTWSVVSGPGTVTFGDATAIDTSASFAVAGNYILRLTANDGQHSVTDDVNVVVNTPPVVNAGPDQSINLPTNSVALDGTVTDNGSVTTTWSVVSGPGTVTFGNSSLVDTSAAFSVGGTYVLRLTANDGLVSVSDDITITVNSVNLPPVVNAGSDQTILHPNSANLDGTVTDENPSVSTLWTLVSGPGAAVFGNAALIDTTVTFSVTGTYVLRLTANDGTHTTTDDITITIHNPPTINAGPNAVIALPNTSAPLDGTLTDDGLPTAATVTWTLVSGPGAVSFDNEHAVDTIAHFQTSGNYVLRLTATDGSVIVSDDVNISVTPPPHTSTEQTTFTAVVGATSDKPQSKVWKHDNKWFSLFTKADGTWIYRLDGTAWTPIVQVLPTSTNAMHADVKVVGNVIHAAIYNQPPGTPTPPAPTLTLLSYEYVSGGSGTYQPWSSRTTAATISSAAAGAETVAMDIDSTGRMWVVWAEGNTVEAAYSTGNYSTFTRIASLATDIVGDDIADVVAIPGGKIGVMWSNQNIDRFVFRIRNDSDPVDTWGVPEIAAAQSALNVGAGMADDHVNLVAGSDGTLYAAVKTSYDTGLNTDIGLLVRRPNGSWDSIYTVDVIGTRPQVVLDESAGLLSIFYTNETGGGTIVMRQSPMSVISFGPETVVLDTDTLDDVTIPRGNVSGELVILATRSSGVVETARITPAAAFNPVAPSANAGADQNITFPSSAILSGIAGDDGMPNPPGAFTTLWTKISGPGTVTFGNAASAATSASFSAGGTYVLRFSVNDGAVSVHDEVTIRVNAPPVVNAGFDQIVTLPTTSASLDATVTDEGLPLPPGAVTTTWSKISGPGTVTFGNAGSVDTTAAFSLPGTYVLRLTANDGSLISTDDITVVVNQPPIVSAGIDQSINMPNAATLDGTITDDNLPTPPGAAAPTWSVVSGPGTVTFGNANAVDTTATFSASGTYVLRLTANDGATSVSDDVTIVVNAPPVVSAGPDRITTQPTNSVSLDGTVTDDSLPAVPGAVTTGWSVVSGPGTVTFGTASAVDTTATFSASGTYVLRLTANDGAVTVTDDVTVVVNVAPVVNAGADQGITVPNAAVLDGTVTDDGLPNPPASVSTTWSVVSGPGSVTFGNASAVDTTASFTVSGVYTLRLTASDGTASVSDDIIITVNTPPVVSAGSDQVVTLPTSTANLDGTVTDDGRPTPPGAVTSTWSQISGPGTATFGNANSVDTTVGFSQSGVYVLRLTANDGSGAVFDEVTITVNNAPNVNAGPNQIITLPGLATLDGTATDDGLPGAMTTTWSVVSGPGSVAFGNASAIDTTAGFTVGGVYVLRLTANDGVATVQDDIQIVVNVAPTVNAGPDRIISLPTSTASLDGTVTDDGLPNPPGTVIRTWSKVSGPGTVTFGNANAEDTNATFGSAGTYVIRLTVNDGQTEVFDEMVVQVNSPPVVSAGPDRNITVPTLSTSLDGNVTDDGLPNPPAGVTYQWTKISGPGTVTFGAPTAVDTSASFSQAGSYTLRLTASDGAVSASDDVVVNINTPPTVSAGLDATVNLPSPANLDGTVTDDGLPTPPAMTTTWTKVSGPGTVTFGNANAIDTTATFSQGGTYVLRLTANDGSGAVLDEVTIFANQAPTVNGGADRQISQPSNSVLLQPIVNDDGLPNPPSTVTTTWSKVSGPGTVTFTPFGSFTQAVFSTTGTYVIRVTANDGAATATDDVTVVYNAQPVVNAGPDLSAISGQYLLLDGSVVDDGLPGPTTATGTWSVVSGPGAYEILDPNSVDTLARFFASGTYVLRLRGTDGATTVDDFVNVFIGDPPTVNAGIDQTISFPTTSVNLDGTANDPDGLPGPLTTTWTKLSGPGTVTFGNASNQDTTATFSAGGTYVLRLTATDGGATVTDDVTISVNYPPVVNAGADQAVLLPGSASLSGTVTDDGLPTPPGGLTYSWSVVDGPGSVTFGNANALATIANFSVNGTYTLRLTASDGTLTTFDDIIITANQPPAVNAGSDQVISYPGNAVLDATVTDDGGPLPPGVVITNWTKVSGPGTVTFGDASAVDTSASFSLPGVYVLRLTADDSAVSTTDDITIVVNQAPTVDAGANQAISLPNAALLDGTVTDDALPNPPGAVTTTWAVFSGPGTVTFGNANAIDTTATFSQGGTYVLRLTASDGATSVNDDVTITVNGPPVVQAGPDQVVTAPSTAILDGTVTDEGLPFPPGATTSTWSVISGPGSVTFGNANAVDTTAIFTTLGTYVLRLTANDGVQTTFDEITVVYNQPPTVNAGVDQEITFPASATLDGTVSDDGRPTPPGSITTTWSKISGPGTVTFGNANAVDTTASFSVGGSYVLRLTVSDGAVSVTDDVTVVVNGPPQVNAGPDVVVTQPGQANLDGTVIDEGLPIPPGATTSTWSVVSGPGSVTFGNANAVDTTATFVTPGTYVLRLTASDGSQIASDDITVIYNVAPTVNAGVDRVISLPTNSVSLDGTVTDDGRPNPPGSVTTGWTMVSGPGSVTFGNAANIDTTATFSMGGTYVLRLTANDGAATVTDEMTVYVDAPPVVNAGPNQSVASNGSAVLDGTVTDDGLPNPPGAVTSVWTKVSGPGTVNFANANAVDTTATFSQPGTYVLRLTASDGLGSANDDISIDVVPPAPTVTNLTNFVVSADSGEKTQSKVWKHNNTWWTVFPTTTGTYLYRLDGTAWTQLIQISTETATHADVKAVGNVTHILLHNTPASPATNSMSLASIQFVAGGLGTYQMWPTRPGNVAISLPTPLTSVETSSIDVDSTGRMWAAWETAGEIQVIYADAPYSTWSAPITIATGVDTSDVAGVIAMPGNKIGVFWSDQSGGDVALRGFRFMTHTDGANPATWSAEESPGSESAATDGGGLAEDQFNMKVGSDGTLYVAVRTRFGNAGSTNIGLLIRRPNGVWDPMYQVENTTSVPAASRPILLLNEAEGTLIVGYQATTSSSATWYKRSTLSLIQFSAAEQLFSGTHERLSTTKQNVTNDAVIVGQDTGTQLGSRLLTFSVGSGEAEATTAFNLDAFVQPQTTTTAAKTGPEPVADEPIVVKTVETAKKKKTRPVAPVYDSPHRFVTVNEPQRYTLQVKEETRRKSRSRFSDRPIVAEDLMDIVIKG